MNSIEKYKKYQYILALVSTLLLLSLFHRDDPTFFDFSENTLERVLLYVAVLPIFFWFLLIVSNKWGYKMFMRLINKEVTYETYHKLIILYLGLIILILFFGIINRGMVT